MQIPLELLQILLGIIIFLFLFNIYHYFRFKRSTWITYDFYLKHGTGRGNFVAFTIYLYKLFILCGWIYAMYELTTIILEQI